MIISQVILARYQDAVLEPWGNVMLIDFGDNDPSGKKGVHITRWGLPEPKPTIEELEEWAKNHPDELAVKPTKKEIALANLAALKGKGDKFDHDALIDAIIAALKI
jgi:hypothetical protein